MTAHPLTDHGEGRLSTLAASGVYALLADGTTVQLRAARPGDLDAVRQMHEAMSRDNSYLRFFSLSRAAAGKEAVRVCRPPLLITSRCWPG